MISHIQTSTLQQAATGPWYCRVVRLVCPPSLHVQACTKNAPEECPDMKERLAVGSALRMTSRRLLPRAPTDRRAMHAAASIVASWVSISRWVIGGWGLGCILHSVGVEWGGNGTILSHISWHFPERSLTVMPQTLGTWHHCCCCLRIAFRGWIVAHLTVLLRLSQPGAAARVAQAKRSQKHK